MGVATGQPPLAAAKSAWLVNCADLIGRGDVIGLTELRGEVLLAFLKARSLESYFIHRAFIQFAGWVHGLEIGQPDATQVFCL